MYELKTLALKTVLELLSKVKGEYNYTMEDVQVEYEKMVFMLSFAV